MVKDADGNEINVDTIGFEPTRAACLDEAKRIVIGARESQYGSPEDCFKRIASFWNTYLEGAAGGRAQITAGDVAAMMALVKLARLTNDPSHWDSWVDIAGYAACGAEVSR